MDSGENRGHGFPMSFIKLLVQRGEEGYDCRPESDSYRAVRLARLQGAGPSAAIAAGGPPASSAVSLASSFLGLTVALPDSSG